MRSRGVFGVEAHDLATVLAHSLVRLTRAGGALQVKVIPHPGRKVIPCAPAAGGFVGHDAAVSGHVS